MASVAGGHDRSGRAAFVTIPQQGAPGVIFDDTDRGFGADHGDYVGFGQKFLSDPLASGTS